MLLAARFLLVLLVTVDLALAAPPHQQACRSLMELFLVVDGSDSINKADYKRLKAALQDLMAELDLGEDRVRVGIVVYSTTIAHVVPLSGNRKMLIKEAKELWHPRDGTMTNIAIARMNQEFKEFGRPGIPKAAIVITDGISKNPSATAEQAKLSNEMGIDMFAVGVGAITSSDELSAIASRPANVIQVESFRELSATLSKMVKTVCPCPPPPEIPFAVLNDGLSSIGSFRNYSCEPGYQMIGDPIIECLADSTWSQVKIECKGCPVPMKNQANAILMDKVVPSPDVIGDVREYQCISGLVAPGPVTITCDAGPDGLFWTNPSYVCGGCPEPMPLDNAAVSAGDKLVGSKREYICNAGFTRSGPMGIECMSQNGVPYWSTVDAACIKCRMPPDIPNAVVDSSGDTAVGARRIYTCTNGFVQTGPIVTTCVAQNGLTGWTPPDHTCVVEECPPVPVLKNAMVPETGLVNSEGTEKTFYCTMGYIETGPLKTKCMRGPKGLYWTEIEHSCVGCDMPRSPPNAVLDPQGDLLVGSVRRFYCMSGYVETGPIEIGCVPQFGKALWTDPEHLCVDCGPPPELPNAVLLPEGDNMVGSRRMYSCIDKFEAIKPVSITCLAEQNTARWSEPDGVCTKIGCADPLPLDHAALQPGENMVNSIRSYKCDLGYFATGPLEVRCEDTAKWSALDFMCIDCGPPPFVPNAQVGPGDSLVGTTREYICDADFALKGLSAVTCQWNATWSEIAFECITCLEPPGIANAVVQPGSNRIRSDRIYDCTPGYLQTGPITTQCMESGIWSTPQHYCRDCGDPFPVENAMIVPGPRTIGSVQQYNCLDGFVATDQAISRCEENAQWTVPQFRCLDKKLVGECMDVIGSLYKVKFNTKDFCDIKPLTNLDYHNLVVP